MDVTDRTYEDFGRESASTGIGSGRAVLSLASLRFLAMFVALIPELIEEEMRSLATQQFAIGGQGTYPYFAQPTAGWYTGSM